MSRGMGRKSSVGDDDRGKPGRLAFAGQVRGVGHLDFPFTAK